MEFNPLVSIVIPVYNGSNYMREAIDSALAQTYTNIEVIVVNDGSTDNTEEIAKSYGDKIRYFVKENGGVATALNLAIKEAKGEYISWLSHDDIYYPNKIQRQIEVLRELEDKNTILFSDFAIINQKTKIKSYFCLQIAHPIYKLNQPLYPILHGLIHGCSLLIPKKCFDEIGYFDNTLKTTQDYDLWFKMFPKYKLSYIPEFLVKSRAHDSQGSKIIPQAKTEADDLWINMLNNISIKEILEMEGSEFTFYSKTFELMKSAGYNKAAKWVECKLNGIQKDLNYSNEIKVSIIIPFKNRIMSLKKAIESVLAQTHKNIELILINDNSTEDISKIADIAKSDSRIILCDNIFKKGASGARNTGIKYATGAYIAFLDSDDAFYPEKIEQQLKFMITNDYMASYTYYEINKDGKKYIPEFIEEETGSFPKIIRGCNIATPTVMIKKCIVDIYNYKFNEDYDYGEDICLWIDISKYFTIKTLKKVLTTVNRNGTNTVDFKHKIIIGTSNIFNHSLNEDSIKYFPQELFDLQRTYIYNELKSIVKQRKSNISKYKITRLIYKIFVRPYLKKKFGRDIVKIRFDKKYL